MCVESCGPGLPGKPESRQANKKHSHTCGDRDKKGLFCAAEIDLRTELFFCVKTQQLNCKQKRRWGFGVFMTGPDVKMKKDSTKRRLMSELDTVALSKRVSKFESEEYRKDLNGICNYSRSTRTL